MPLPETYTKFPFRHLYEILRVSEACDVPLECFSDCLQQSYAKYDQFWVTLRSTVSKMKGNPLPEKSSQVAWSRAAEGFKGVGLGGRLQFLQRPNGPVFGFSLHPLKIEASYRLARKFGHDRFCVIQIPGLGSDSLPPYLKPDQVAAREVIIKWLVETKHNFLGRTWRAYYVKSEGTRKSQRRTKKVTSDAKYRIHLFAEDGVNFRQESFQGEIDPRGLIHTRVSIKGLVDWFMLSESNLDQPALKFFNRLGLGWYHQLSILGNC